MKDAWLHLGVSSDAGMEEIERAYAIKRRLYDSSRFAQYSQAWDEARKMSEIIEEAYHYAKEAASSAPTRPESAERQDAPIERPTVTLTTPAGLAPSREEPKARAHWTAFAVGALAVAVFCLAGVLFFRGRDDRVKELEAANQTPSIDFNAALREVREEASRPAVAAKPAMDAEALAAKGLPSIVRIETDVNNKLGSGFFVSNRGDILTNYHVIEGMREIRVIPHGGRASLALVKGIDPDGDMALLVLREPRETPFLKISETMPKQGEAVMALGNPQGLDSTVSNGIVSGFRVDGRLVQFTAPISPGSSGGALIDARGEVVGMPTLLLTEGQNLNFAIAPTVLRQFFASVRDATPRPMPQPKAQAPAPSQTQDGRYEEDLIFVRKDKSYEIYLDVNSIIRNEGSPFVSFRTVWYPSEEMKERMAADPNFHLLPGKELGRAVLFYEVDFSDGTFMHLRTVNFCTDGSIARDWRWPSDKLKWERPEKGGRIESLMSVLCKLSGETTPKVQTPKRPSKSKD
ncbi:MAG: serine protease, partial [Synergistaceae bacterium]|nr:serine protease [Synergistaceae bacterium]